MNNQKLIMENWRRYLKENNEKLSETDEIVKILESLNEEQLEEGLFKNALFTLGMMMGGLGSTDAAASDMIIGGETIPQVQVEKAATMAGGLPDGKTYGSNNVTADQLETLASAIAGGYTSMHGDIDNLSQTDFANGLNYLLGVDIQWDSDEQAMDAATMVGQLAKKAGSKAPSAEKPDSVQKQVRAANQANWKDVSQADKDAAIQGMKNIQKGKK